MSTIVVHHIQLLIVGVELNVTIKLAINGYVVREYHVSNELKGNERSDRPQEFHKSDQAI